MLDKCDRCGGQLVVSRWDGGAVECVQCGHIEYGAFNVAVADRREDNWRGNIHMIPYVGGYPLMKDIRVKSIMSVERGAEQDNRKARRDMWHRLMTIFCPFDEEQMECTSVGTSRAKTGGRGICYTCPNNHLITLRTAPKDPNAFVGWV